MSTFYFRVHCKAVKNALPHHMLFSCYDTKVHVYIEMKYKARFFPILLDQLGMSMVCYITKAKLLQEAMNFVIVLLTSSKYPGPKWPLSTWKASFIHLRQVISLLSTPWPFWTCIFISSK